MAAVRVILVVFAGVMLAGCGGDSPAAPTFTVGGTVTGLSSAGLVLQNNGGNNRVVAASGGSFTFTTGVADGSTYNVTVLVQPVTQNCIVSNGSGTIVGANVTSVTVTCTTPTFTIGGTVTGLSSPGLVLTNNGGDNLTVATNGTFTFNTPIASGSVYSVRILTIPPNHNCQRNANNSDGTVAKTNITSVTIVCEVPFAAYEVVTQSATTGAASTLGTAFVICPGTKRVMGGGYRSESGTEVWRVWRSRPVDASGVQTGDRGWGVSFTSVVAGQSVFVHAICATPNVGYEVVTANALTGPVSTDGTVSVPCTGSFRVMGGGYSSNPLEVWRVGRNRGVDAGGALTGSVGWTIDFTSVVAGQNVAVHAVCGSAPTDLVHQVVTANATTGAPGTLGTVSVICGGTRRVLGGGYTSAAAAEAWRVWRSYPVNLGGAQLGDRGWAVDFTSVVAGATVSAFAVCGAAPG